ncbi:urea transporter [Rhodobacter sp. Har01]|uniref:urea transporter n=1 Tax=Rhodobacter sp. Har01 TaxID=2883999 RepID=UPI001D082C3F|nr:urea transporter [Rhodobacter sp. Har01]MCB6179957.1 urea transporter [Rhodobacter sp. Har01]
MTMRLSRTGLAEGGSAPGLWLAEFIDSTLRGVGQVMLQNNAYTGLVFVLGVFCNSTVAGVAVLAGSMASTLAAMILGAERALVRAGLFGFNGALVAVALVAFLRPEPLSWLCILLAAAFSTVVFAALLALLDTWKLPPLTAPFVFVTLSFVLASRHLSQLPPEELLAAAVVPDVTALSASMLAEGVLNGFAQVFLQESPVTGAVFAFGLLIGSKRAFAAGIAGSLIGLLVAWGLGASIPALQSGLFGYNGVLVAIGFGSTLCPWSRNHLAHVLAPSIATPLVYAVIATALEPMGLPALTLPFVLVTWLFLLACKPLPRLRARQE